MTWTPSLNSMTSDALLLVFWLSLPPLLAATAVGLLVGLVQSVTQIQDQALPYAVKIICVGVVLMIAVPWARTEVSHYFDQALTFISLGRVR
jgi:type III secretion protein S